VADSLKDIAGMDGSPSMEGRIMNLVLSPMSLKQGKATKVKEENPGAEIKDS
jgi:hypothetical protein